MGNGIVSFVDTLFGQDRFAPLTRKNKFGNVQEQDVPEVCAFYNQNMNGVDVSDQERTGFYGIEMRSRQDKYTLRMFDGLFCFVMQNGLRI